MWARSGLSLTLDFRRFGTYSLVVERRPTGGGRAKETISYFNHWGMGNFYSVYAPLASRDIMTRCHMSLNDTRIFLKQIID